MLDRADIEAALDSLSKRRPVFHSEADFQFALAWEVQKRHPEVEIRLEYPVPLKGEQGRVDIWIEDSATAIELKYWTHKGAVTVDTESFVFADGAPVWERYEFWKDVARIERLISLGQARAGFVIALTHSQGFWTGEGLGTTDEAFRLWEGRGVGGTLDWSAHTGAGTRQDHEKRHELRGRYLVHWRNYPASSPSTGGGFRYLMLDVGAALAEGET